MKLFENTIKLLKCEIEEIENNKIVCDCCRDRILSSHKEAIKLLEEMKKNCGEIIINTEVRKAKEKLMRAN